MAESKKAGERQGIAAHPGLAAVLSMDGGMGEMERGNNEDELTRPRMHSKKIGFYFRDRSMPNNGLLKWIELLCGQSATPLPYMLPAIEIFPTAGLTRGQLNEILLGVQLDRVSEGFFYFVFRVDKITNFEHFKKCIEEFRKKSAILCGNFKYSFKNLRTKSIIDIEKIFLPITELDRNRFNSRPQPVVKIKTIEPNNTYYLGYIVENELKSLGASDKIELMNAIRIQGKHNHDTYLDYDYMDFYIATSMREKLDFWNVSRFAVELAQSNYISDLNLRFFDPTQAFCEHRIDKGLVEALMLRRAKCTIYLVGETETLGKDSELAATLAQGKTVIAYVPTLGSFEKFKSDYVEKALTEVYPEEDNIKIGLDFLKSFWPDGAWTDAKIRGWLANPTSVSFDDLLKTIYDKAKILYDRRAKMLKEIHPLSLQVHLETGVANGVLVARTVQECAKLLSGVILIPTVRRPDSRGFRRLASSDSFGARRFAPCLPP